MNRTQAAHMPTHFSRYKGLVVDDVIPTETMRLHTRLFAWTRRKHIAVKDADNSQLNAYLINPAYLDHSVVAPIPAPVSKNVSPHVIQYSQISRNIPSSRATSILQAALIRSKQTASLAKTKVAAFAGAVVTHVKTVFHGANTYTLQRGARRGWSRRLATFATALALVGAGSIPFITSDQSAPQTTGQGTAQISQQGNSIPDQSSRSIPESNTIPLFKNNSTQDSVRLSREVANPNMSTRSTTTPQAATPVYSAPLVTQSAPSAVNEEVNPAPTTSSPEQTVTTPVAPDPTIESEPMQPLEETTEPAPLVEGVTYTVTETVTDTTNTVNGAADNLGL